MPTWYVLAFGREKATPTAALTADYAQRVQHLQPLELRVLNASKAATPAQRKQQEQELLWAKLKPGVVVCLSERGQGRTTAQFAQQLRGWQDAGQVVSFLIGGADGHSAQVEARADYLLKVSDFTLPHLIARVVLLEQLYRALSANAGHPYHRE